MLANNFYSFEKWVIEKKLKTTNVSLSLNCHIIPRLVAEPYVLFIFILILIHFMLLVSFLPPENIISVASDRVAFYISHLLLLTWKF